ncbi:hypothetical protein DPMN_170344 [Dreissena polymorpha]|uniref:Uncharacterized protein n=1 Tax=Dreissena polymorpha TaxID=45954 RepID=A0A9D4DZL7_DREPO|nr:hypothetical protein DPMN_170344 [Dreissena polymorpha]
MYFSHIMKNAPPPGGHVFQPTGTIFELFHDNRTINVASRVLTRKNALAPGGHAFQPTGTIFELIQDNIETNTQQDMLTSTQLVTKFVEDRKKLRDRQTDRQSDSYMAPITNGNGGIISVTHSFH